VRAQCLNFGYFLIKDWDSLTNTLRDGNRTVKTMAWSRGPRVGSKTGADMFCSATVHHRG
jgi:hypothetical protein